MASFPEVDSRPIAIAGLRMGTACAAIKAGHLQDDLAVFELAEGTACTAVLTQNAFCAAPVTVAREHLAQSPSRSSVRYLLINSGNANAGSGSAGLAVARSCCQALGTLRGCAGEQVLPFSTGVIGELLPMARIVKALPDACARLDAAAWDQVAQAIMTTDTVPKTASCRLEIDGHEVCMTGIAKGSGMIHPDMATMLAFVATDAAIAPAIMSELLQSLVVDSFNAITIDGDTSTNDACVLMATGRSSLPKCVSMSATAMTRLRQGLQALFDSLARQIVRDGEGASKLMTIQVEEGRDEAECRQVAFTIAHSPLVKTAFFASDPNWGRILAAVGRAGIDALDVARVSLFLGEVCIVSAGGRDPAYTEARGAAVMAERDILIRVLLGRGRCQSRIWTSDLSYDYVRINAEYRS